MISAVALVLIAAGGAFLPRLPGFVPPRPPPRFETARGGACEEALFLSLGLRRLLADVWMVRLLLYYGAAEEAMTNSAGEQAEISGSGGYPEIAARAAGILALDPSFSYAVLYASGALAFNLGRPGEAIELLRRGLAADPGNWRYRAYIGAIGLEKNGDRQGAVDLLEPALDAPDCPAMIKSIAAFLYIKLGENAKAAALYRKILEDSRDPGYQAMARRGLARLFRAARSHHQP
jgi:tetratricopeptide (TPR) repeat protein